MKFSNHDMAELFREMRPQGWSVELTGSNHIRWTHTSGARVITSNTPRDNYAVNQARRDLMRAMKTQETPVATPQPFNGIRFPFSALPKRFQKPILDGSETAEVLSVSTRKLCTMVKHGLIKPRSKHFKDVQDLSFDAAAVVTYLNGARPDRTMPVEPEPETVEAAKKIVTAASSTVEQVAQKLFTPPAPVAPDPEDPTPSERLKKAMVDVRKSARDTLPPGVVLKGEACEILGKSPGWLEARIAAGIIAPVSHDTAKYVEIAGGFPPILFNRADVDALKAMVDAGEAELPRKPRAAAAPPPPPETPKPAPVPVVTPSATNLRDAALALRDLCDKDRVVRVVLEKRNGKWALELQREVVTVATETGDL